MDRKETGSGKPSPSRSVLASRAFWIGGALSLVIWALIAASIGGAK